MAAENEGTDAVTVVEVTQGIQEEVPSASASVPSDVSSAEKAATASGAAAAVADETNTANDSHIRRHSPRSLERFWS